MEIVDILLPPTFEKSGKTKTIQQAWDDGDWIGTFNLWIVKNNPMPSIVYQIRSGKSSWAPGKIDVTAGGHYSAGEEIKDGLREVREELGKDYDFQELTYIGRKISVTPDIKGIMRHTVVDIVLIKDESNLDSYILEENEVFAICECSINELIKVHTEPGYEFEIEVTDFNKNKFTKKITKDSFPYNWDNYHLKIALLAERFLKGEKNLIY